MNKTYRTSSASFIKWNPILMADDIVHYYKSHRFGFKTLLKHAPNMRCHLSPSENSQ